jgi:hypothetical protein
MLGVINSCRWLSGIFFKEIFILSRIQFVDYRKSRIEIYQYVFLLKIYDTAVSIKIVMIGSVFDKKFSIVFVFEVFLIVNGGIGIYFDPYR